MLDLGQYSRKVQMILSSLDGGRRRAPLSPVGPERGEGLDILRKTSSAALFDGDEPTSAPFAECVRSALFLYYSALDDSHTISQNIHSTTGSFLHGIMHRQEPDYSNARYWFRQVGDHELYPTLREEALRLSLKTDSLKAGLASRKRWDAMWFIDLCEQGCKEAGTFERDVVELQRLEWELLFDYCYRRALAG